MFEQPYQDDSNKSLEFQVIFFCIHILAPRTLHIQLNFIIKQEDFINDPSS